MAKIYKKGITLIELVIVIIILILLAVIAIWNTQGTAQRAEAAAIMAEFKSMYEAVTTMKDLYDSGYELVSGEDYCETVERDGETWYVVYGMQDLDKYNSKVVEKFLGIDELQRSYEFRLNESYENNIAIEDDRLIVKDVEVRYYNGRYVTVAGYDIRSYTDIQSVRNEITR